MIARALHCLAPAKLNLFLHITGRRPDGYHDLQTLFQLLDFGDEMTFTPNDSGLLSLSAHGPTANTMPLDGNLILRAAELLRATCPGKTLGADILIDKRLPAGAGLGGGSSDAAATLVSLNQLWELGLTREQLGAIGITLGADVPVFVRGHSAWAEGVGEKLTDIMLGPRIYLVATPNCAVSTAEIFGMPDLTRNTQAIKMPDFLAGRSRNDCEAVTRRLYPLVASTIDWLAQYASARMTGTGASVFAEFNDSDSAQAALRDLPDYCTGFVARGIDKIER
ncbi:4-(cytidine 5'-diphospho)-2-C-methyl-D-erythritol kinase [Gammaproteobacteria bacterium]|jgi:4-diphosphocytidyl-2-C-methyl-D-erythritol kinase|nr:4-(cytidine 5'-diphospho)-2-C-methyl-D-erythritol kinase [Gammaproteobacteria bacterium]MDA9567709.1 4-(cytidine 5'-diphospho)-2-C-methyl-D-erythritol kinase [Gammaproteobacteria bacterium]